MGLAQRNEALAHRLGVEQKAKAQEGFCAWIREPLRLGGKAVHSWCNVPNTSGKDNPQEAPLTAAETARKAAAPWRAKLLAPIDPVSE